MTSRHPPSITYLGHSLTPEPSVTFAFAGGRWEYFLSNPAALDKVLYVARVASAAKAAVLAKRLAIRDQRL